MIITNMGVEIFPVIVGFMEVIVGTVAAIALIIIVINARAYYRARQHKNEPQKEQAHSNIITALITITIALIAYFLLSSIGPAFRLLIS